MKLELPDFLEKKKKKEKDISKVPELKEDILTIEQQKDFKDKIVGKFTPITVIVKHSFAPIVKIHRARRIEKKGINYLKISGVGKKIIEPKTQRRYSDGKKEILVFETDGKGNYNGVDWKDHEFVPLMSDEEKVAFQNTLDAVEQEYENKGSFWEKFGPQIQVAIIMVMALVVINFFIENMQGYCGYTNSHNAEVVKNCVDMLNTTISSMNSPPIIQ